jgi:hypothetical protein
LAKSNEEKGGGVKIKKAIDKFLYINCKIN